MHRRFSRFLCLAALAALAVGWSGFAHADVIPFDPDGPANPNPFLAVASFDEAPGNVLALGSVPGGILPVGFTFDALFQARIAGLNGPGGPIAVPGLNTGAFGTLPTPAGFTGFEITVVARFREVVTSTTVVGTGVINTFSVIPSPTSFIEFWFDDGTVAGALPSSDLAGTGFADGLLILAGKISAGDSAFFVPTVLPPFPDLDGFIANDYPLIDSLDGSGSASDLTGPVTSYLTTFFGVLPPLFIATSITDSLQESPFDSVNPSDKFVTAASGAAGFMGVAPTADIGADTVAAMNTLGPVNGLSGPDFQFEGDAQTEFSVVPEPSTLALCLMGMGGLGFRQLRRRFGSRVS